MYQIKAKADSMLSLFSGTGTYQPFRNQKLVSVLVDFKEWKEFIRLTSNSSKRWLFFENKVYQKALTRPTNTMLYKVFYVEMARAVTLELALAIKSGKDCTVICPTFVEVDKEVQQVTLDSCYAHSAGLPFYEESRQRVLAELSELVSLDKLNETATNQKQMLEYAIFLKTQSRQQEIRLYELGGY